jgi:Flp pilus assembly protein TadG
MAAWFQIAAAPANVSRRGAVIGPMGCSSHSLLGQDRAGTAAIEFALILPLLALLVIGLADQVRHSLAMMDVDAVATTGAAMAVRQGFDPARIGAAMAAQNDSIAIDAITLVTCGNPNSGKGNNNGNGAGVANGNASATGVANANTNANGGAHVVSDCPTLPAGRYARITASTDSPSLFGDVRPAKITATALVRLP